MRHPDRNLLLTLAACAVLALGLGACSSTQSASTQVDDAALTAAVKSKLVADPEINPFNIDVDSNDGVVTLTGRVATQAAKNEAGQIAGSTEGVVRVDNRLEVGEEMATGSEE